MELTVDVGRAYTIYFKRFLNTNQSKGFGKELN